MNYKDSDGYILIDMSIADISKSTQSIPGIYDRIVSVLDTNKLVLVINFGEYSPMPAIARKKLNYYVITTNLFIITINSNDVVIIEEAGESTVDVSIVPTYIEGTKIADYTIGEQEGAIYIPEVQSEINDNVTASNTTWSSDKISDELALKATTASLTDVAFTGSYDDLIDKPTIPDELNDLDDVALTSPSNGQTLVFDATEGKFINQTPPSGVTTLAGLSDVDITTPASGNILSFDGTNWTNETITAADIEYSSGVSVADKIGDMDKSTSQTLIYSGVSFVFTRKGNTVMVRVSHNSQVTFSNVWTNLGTLTDDFKPSAYTYCGMIFPAGHFLQLRINQLTGEVDIASDTSANMYPQGSTSYLV